MRMKPVIQILLDPALKKEKWILNEVFLRVGIPFAFVEKWDDFAIKIRYGLQGPPGADLLLKEKSSGWNQLNIPLLTRIEGYEILHLPHDKPDSLFSNKCFNIDIVGMGEYFLSGRGMLLNNNDVVADTTHFDRLFKKPLLDIACAILREFIKNFPNHMEMKTHSISFWPNNAKVVIAITHDLDHLALGGITNFFYDVAFGRTNEILLHKQFVASLKQMVAYGFIKQFMPIRQCIELEMRNSIKATYFVYTGNKDNPLNPSYDFNDKIPWNENKVPLRTVVKDISDKGFEIALHASTISATDPVNLSIEVLKIIETIGIEQPIGIRHHRLAFDQEVTPKIQSSLGVKYDSTLGFNRKPGFVSGTAYPYHLFTEIKEKNSYSLIEIPIIAQDFHLIDGFSLIKNDNVISNILRSLELGEGGVLNLIWHPERFLNKKFGKKLFDSFNELLLAQKDRYWFATLSEIADRWIDIEKKLIVNNI